MYGSSCGGSGSSSGSSSCCSSTVFEAVRYLPHLLLLPFYYSIRGAAGFEKEQKVRPQFQGIETSSPIDGSYVKYSQVKDIHFYL